jgi:hypothetical protein
MAFRGERILIACAIAACVSCGRSRSNAAQPVDEDAQYNFRFRAPSAAWSRADTGQIDPGAALAYARTEPEISFLVYASRSGEEIGVSRLVEDWKKQLAARASGPVDVTATPLEIRGVSGTRAVALANVQGMRVAYENWLIERNGYSYQLVAWGNAADRAKIAQEARGLFTGFELIDPAARIPPPRRPAKPYASADVGWSIDLGAPWTEWRSVRDRIPAAEYAATCGDASIAVAAVPLLGFRVPADAAVASLLELLEIRSPQELPRRAIRSGSWSGYELPYEKQVNGRWMRYRIHALVGEDAALVAAEWRPPEQPDSECTEALERIDTRRAHPAALDKLERKAVAARFFADLGRRLHASGRVREGASAFAQAGALAPENAAYLFNEVRALQQLGRSEDAFHRVATRLHGAQCASPLRIEAAELLAEMGRSPEAIATWTSAFSCGYRDSAALSRYLRFLEREGRMTLAFHEAQTFADRSDLPRLRGQIAAANDPR